MTPKEKAKELFLKHWKITIDNKQSKQCALVSVDELIEHSYQVMKPFWQEVKQEIEKL